MLLTVTTTHRPASDLGHLLHKHPDRAQRFDVATGVAHVFYPEVSDARCTAALLLEVDPIALAAGTRGRSTGLLLGQYVNDRPYAASSLLAVAVGRVFGSALKGRGVAREELAATPIPLELRLPALPCEGGPELAGRLFGPLGWEVSATPVALDPAFPEWGPSRYVDLVLTGTVRLADALAHLYVLLPVLDGAKHYWVGDDEVGKLVRTGGTWLAAHPERQLITARYLAHQRGYTAEALARLAELDESAPETEPEPEEATGHDAADRRLPTLAQQRRAAILAALRAAAATRVVDLGCGEGALLRELLADPAYTEIVGVDVAARALDTAAARLRLDTLPERQRSRVRLLQGSVTYADPRLAGFDAVVLSEVVEHVDPPRLPALRAAVFGVARPATVLVTTPNAEYNALWPTLPAGTVRHPDHRFEWTRAEFAAWAEATAAAHGYAVRLEPVGPVDSGRGAPTQLAVFTRSGGMRLVIPELSLVALVGVSGSGKSTFARTHFAPTQVLSSDAFRALVADDENDQAATPDAFDALYYVAGRRLRAGRLTVVDATNVRREDRATLVAAAREHDVLPVAIVFDLPDAVTTARNAGHRALPDRVLRRQRDALARSVRHLAREGFRKVHVLSTVEDVESAEIVWEKAYNDRRELAGPFDVIGDVHGCRAELETLLDRLGYRLDRDATGHPVGAAHPDGRTAVFVGDLVDRGPDTPGVLRLVMGMVAAGTALCVAGNHENKLVRALDGKKVTVSHGLAESLSQLAAEPGAFRAAARDFMDGLVSHYRLDGGALVVAHAGLKEEYQGRSSGRVRAFCLYGETTGETDEYGLPVRYPWANDYRGAAAVVYGHTPVASVEWVNNTACLDTGCVFGGELSALRWPERSVVAVPADGVHYEPVRPLAPPVPERDPDLLRLDDVLGPRGVETGVLGRVAVREENAAGALEVMSRFAIDPHWLVYLPPTMSPCATAGEGGLLEHPAGAFAGFRRDGVDHVVCEEKHMGSRAVVVLCRDGEVARRRFRATDGATGALYTRTGRAFFADADRTERLLARLRAAVDKAGLWAELETDWLVLDAELLPWSAKAGDLLRGQYAQVGAAARAVLPAAVAALDAAAARGLDVADLAARQRSRLANAEAFTVAYGRYCWPVEDLAGVELAPFAVLAGEGRSYADRDHAWQLAIADRLADAAPGFVRATRRIVVDLADDASVEAGTAWWTELTGAGGEGMVVKPLGGLVRGRHGVVQPGVKCRGREYLRIIYGPDYTDEENLARLRQRGLGRKRSLALREYALGLEALARFAAGEPLWRVHGAVFAVLALESEPVDPRL